MVGMGPLGILGRVGRMGIKSGPTGHFRQSGQDGHGGRSPLGILGMVGRMGLVSSVFSSFGCHLFFYAAVFLEVFFLPFYEAFYEGVGLHDEGDGDVAHCLGGAFGYLLGVVGGVVVVAAVVACLECLG